MRIGIRSRIHSNPGAKCELVNGFSLAIFFSSPLSLSLSSAHSSVWSFVLVVRSFQCFTGLLEFAFWENRACLQVGVGIRYMIRCNVLAATFNDDK